MNIKTLITLLSASVSMSLYSQTQLVQQANVIIQDDPATTSVTEGNLRISGGIAIGDATISGSKSIVIGDSNTSATGNYSLALGESLSSQGPNSLLIGTNLSGNGSKNLFVGNYIRGSAGDYSFMFGDNMQLGITQNSFFKGSRVLTYVCNNCVGFGTSIIMAHTDNCFAFGDSIVFDNTYPGEGPVLLYTKRMIGSYAFGKGSGIHFTSNSFSIGNGAQVYGLIYYAESNPWDVNQMITAENSFAIGKSARVDSAGQAYAIGADSIVECFGQITLGSFNEFTSLRRFDADGTSMISYKTEWNANDPLLVLGNGTSATARSNAMVVLKNGDTTINGKLKVAQAGGGISMGSFGPQAAGGSTGQ